MDGRARRESRFSSSRQYAGYACHNANLCKQQVPDFDGNMPLRCNDQYADENETQEGKGLEDNVLFAMDRCQASGRTLIYWFRPGSSSNPDAPE